MKPANGDLDQLYEGATLLVKVSGREINGPNFPRFADDAQRLQDTYHTKLVIVFGGGDQIDAEWNERHPTARPKIDGVAVTSMDVLHDAVLPAYAKVRDTLRSRVSNIRLLRPDDVQCEMLDEERFGLVGRPTHINLPDVQTAGVGFVGMHRDQLLNVNADDIALGMVQQYPGQFNEAFFLTDSGGVYDIDGKVVPSIMATDIASILDGTHQRVRVEGGMKKKIASVDDMVRKIGKIAIINARDFGGELSELQGKRNAGLRPVSGGVSASLASYTYHLPRSERGV